MTSFSVRIYAREKAPHQINTARAFKEGLKRHGIESTIENPMNYTQSDLAVVWGMRQERVIRCQREEKSDFLVMENGYLGDRLQNPSLGFNGLNGYADFYADDVPSDRGEKWAHLIKPWKDGGDYYLICGQVLGDASLEGVDYIGWLHSIPQEHAGKPVKFRPHPVGFGYTVAHTVTQGSLAHDLDHAAGVITFNSNSAVDALLAGVPVVVSDKGSMVYHDVGHTLDDWKRPDRRKIVDRLAYCQWTHDEISQGLAWDHLRTRYA